MLIILGTVMKVIGIVLLSILAIILLLLALILFVPIRYGAEGQFDEKPTLKYQVKWFLPFCYLRGGYREGFYYEGKVFGFTLLSNEKKKKSQKNTPESEDIEKENRKKAKKHGKKQKENESAKDEAKANDIKESTLCEEAFDGAVADKEVTDKETSVKNVLTNDSSSEKYAEDDLSTISEADQSDFDEDEVATDEEDTFSQEEMGKIAIFFSKIKTFLCEKILQKLQKAGEKVLAWCQKLKCTFYKICDKIKEIWKKIDYYQRLWELESTQNEIRVCKERIGKALKHILPYKFRAELQLGFEDPATTGNVMGIWGMLYPWIGEQIRVVPYFDEQIMKGHFYLKGRICVFTVLVIAIQFYFDKELRKLIRRVKRHSFATVE